MKCPSCKTPDLLMTERQGIEIDYCPQCRGVWLDRGELDKFIQQAERQASTPVREERVVAPPPHPQDSGYRRSDYQRREDYDRDPRREYSYEDRDKYHGKKRKSFWGELFDFD